MAIKIGISGLPGSGKTTLIKEISKFLLDKGYKIVGFYTEEVRESGRRVGFIAKRIDKNSECILAWIGARGPKIGKYGVLVEEFEKFIDDFIKDLDLYQPEVIIVDEIGPMELKSGKFNKLINILFDPLKGYNLLFTLHRSLYNSWKNKKDVILFWLTRERFNIIKNKVLEMLQKSIIK